MASNNSTGIPELPAEQLSVNLNVLSPSTLATAGGPLSFPDLPAATTIRELKDKIRQTLPMKPTDAQQRLIYRGRPLQVDDETLLHLMGETTLRDHNQQTIHLVIRGVDTQPQSSAQSSAQIPAPSSIRGRSPVGDHRSFLSQAAAQGRQQSPHQHLGPTPPPGLTRRVVTNREPVQGFGIPNPPSSFSPQQMQQMQSQIQSMAAWGNGLQREAVNRAMVNQQINQNQSSRPAAGTPGLGDNHNNNHHHHHAGTGQSFQGSAFGIPLGEAPQGRMSPGASPYTRTTVREGTFADGQPYRVTNTETWTPLSITEVQNILRGGDAGQATQAMTNAMQRSESPASLGSGIMGGGGGPGVTTPYYPTMGSRAGSRGATPDPTSRSVSGGSTNATNATNAGGNTAPGATGTYATAASPTPSGPEVYILSSPQGPRGLLINNNDGAYYTPLARQTAPQTSPLLPRVGTQPRVPWQLPNLSSPTVTHDQQHQQAQHINLPYQPRHNASQPASPQARVHRRHRRRHQPQQQAQQQAQAQPQGQGVPPMAPIRNPHANNPLGPLAAQLWQHFWLTVRLAIFVWWFASRSSSWSRWATVIAIAFGIFLFNTGLLNGLFDQAAGPVRRHMDNLIPVVRPGVGAGNQNVVRGAAAAAGGNQPHVDGVGGVEPNPAQAAARLVADRRHANANWLMDQVRRLERAGLLFLASIAPGVAERHIAQLEAEERAERRRREEAEAAAAAAAAAATAAEPDNRNADTSAGGGQQERGGEGEPAVRDGAEARDEEAGGNGDPGASEQARQADNRAEPIIAQ